MKRLTPLLLVSLWLISTVLRAAPGAGTIMLSQLPGERDYSVLLADHQNSSRGFASFGGRLSGDSVAEAAARESAEESRFQYSVLELLPKVESAIPLMLGSFTVYVIEVDPIPAKQMEEASTACAGCVERESYLWLPLRVMDELVADDRQPPYRIPEQYLPGNAKRDYLWPKFATLYRAAKPLVRGLISSQ